MSRREGPPGRETAAARTRERRIWYGHGSLARTEKTGVALFLHDTARVFGEVSALSLPALLVIAATPPWTLAAAEPGLLAWLTMTLVGTLIRGGWVHPPASATPGWVRLGPSLLVLRLGYFNAVMLLAAVGGATVGPAAPFLGPAWAVLVAALGMLIFPRAAEEWTMAWQ